MNYIVLANKPGRDWEMALVYGPFSTIGTARQYAEKLERNGMAVLVRTLAPPKAWL